MTQPGNETQDVNKEEVKDELSKVASSPKKNIAILILIAGVFCILFYNLFIADLIKSDSNPKPKSVNKADIASPNKAEDLPPIPTLPSPPKPIMIEPPAVPPPAPIVPATPIALPAPLPAALPASLLPPPTVIAPPTGTILNNEELTKKEARRKSSMIIKDSLSSVKAEVSATITKMTNLGLTLGRGKIIDAILESAVSTDFGGEVRAIISRDVYSESGHVVLIPKGSRIFGSYSKGVNSTYGRIDINWDRIDLSTGYRLSLASYTVDDLGRKGVQGRVDNKYAEKITNALLTSAFSILSAKGIDQMIPPVSSNEASSKAQATSTAITSAAVAAYQDTSKTYADVCNAITGAIEDKTSAAYQQALTQCTTLGTNTSYTTDVQKKTAALTLATTIANSALSSSITSTTPTKAQTAAEDAYKNMSTVVADILTQNKYETTITINQGEAVKIYVTKDYEFPIEAVNGPRVME